MQVQVESEKVTNNLAFFFFLIQGIASLVSWNAVLNGIDYFIHQYPQYEVYFVFPIAVTASQLICCLLVLKITQLFSLTLRVMASLITLMLVLVFLPVEATLFGGSNFGFWFIVALLCLLGFFNTVLSASLSGLVSLFPAKYATYMMMGTSMAGLTMNGLRAIFIVSLKHAKYGDVIGIILYFAVAGLIVIVSMVIHPIFIRSKFYKLYMIQSGDVEALIGEQNTELIKKETVTSTRRTFAMMLKALKEVWIYILLMVLSQIQTFTTFPAMMLKKPIHGMGLEWKIVTMVATFNVFCIVGQKIAQFRKYYNRLSVMLILLGRTILSALFVIQAVRTDISGINTVWFCYFNIVLFAFTFGFVTTALFILATEAVQPDKKEVVGYMSVFASAVGVTMGAILSLPFKDMGHMD